MPIQSFTDFFWRKHFSSDFFYTPLETNMTLENPPFSIGNTSSNGGFPIVILVFRGVVCTVPEMKLLPTSKCGEKNIKKSAMDLFSLEPKSYIQSSSYETMKGVFEDSYKNYSTLGTADLRIRFEGVETYLADKQATNHDFSTAMLGCLVWTKPGGIVTTEGCKQQPEVFASEWCQ